MGMDDPDRVATLLLFATAYQRHPYRFPVIGEIEIYNQLTQEQVMQYYKTRYVPNNLTFIVVGDVDAEKVRQQLTGLFKPYPETSLKPLFIPAEPPQLGRREVNEEFATELTHLSLAWHIPEVTNPDVPALDLSRPSLAMVAARRLYRRVREESGLAFSISAFSYTPVTQGCLGLMPRSIRRNATQPSNWLCGLSNGVKQAGVTAEELEKAKKITLSHHLGALTTMRGQASDIGSNWLLTRDLNFSRHYLDAVQKVTLDDIKRVAANYLTENNLTVVSLNPKGSLTGKAEPKNQSPRVKFKSLISRMDCDCWCAKILDLPLVGMGAVFRGGLLAETPQTNGITRLMAKVLLKGTKTRTAEQIANEIEAGAAQFRATPVTTASACSVDVTKPDVKLGVDLLSDVLLNATFPEKAVAREKEIQMAAIKQEEEQLTSVARNIMRQALFPQHPYALRSNGSVESVQKLTQKDLLRISGSLRSRKKRGHLRLWGDVKASEVKQLVDQMLGEMKPGALALTDAKPSMPLGKPETVENRKDKAQGVIMVGFRGASLSSPDRYALELIDEASSDLGSRFFIRIREQMGLAYYVGASEMQGLVPGLFAFYLGTDPQKIEPVKTALLDEIHKLANDGLTPELTRAKKKLIGQQEIANQSNDAFGYHCALDEIYGLGFDYYKRLEHDVNAVTLDDIKQVAAKYFRDQPYVLATVRPPEKK